MIARSAVRKAALFAMSALAVLSLSGCLRVESTAYVDNDAKISKVQLVYAVDKDAMKSLGSLGGSSDSKLPTDLNSFKESMLSSDKSGKLAKICAFTESSTEWVATCEASASDIKDASAGQSAQVVPDVSLSANNGVIDLSYTPKDTSTTGGMATEQAASMGVSAVVRFSFPGEVTSVSGPGASKDGNVVTIDMFKVKDGQVITAQAKTSGGTGFLRTAVVVALVLCVVAFGAIVYKKFSNKGDEGEDLEQLDPLAPVASPEAVETLGEETPVEESAAPGFPVSEPEGPAPVVQEVPVVPAPPVVPEAASDPVVEVPESPATPEGLNPEQ